MYDFEKTPLLEKHPIIKYRFYPIMYQIPFTQCCLIIKIHKSRYLKQNLEIIPRVPFYFSLLFYRQFLSLLLRLLYRRKLSRIFKAFLSTSKAEWFEWDNFFLYARCALNLKCFNYDLYSIFVTFWFK